MLDSQGAASLSVVNLVTPVGAAANTAAATSAWTQVTRYAGYMAVIQSVGTISTGTLIGTIQSATDGSGTGAATVGTFATVTTSNDAPNHQTIVLPATIGNYIRYVGTLSAGTADISVSLIGSKQSV
jgi:hypothetical protein